jgi:two-component system sensor histidine kinase ResE
MGKDGPAHGVPVRNALKSPSLRTKILAAILGAVAVTVVLGTWALNQHISAGAQREADGQARALTAQARALYRERAATLVAEGEAISLYPAVIGALADGNTRPLLQWAGQVAALQHTRVTVTDAHGNVLARGHAPEQAGDELASRLEGLRLARAGQKVSGTEDGDELGLALRGYAPVLREGQVVGVVMLADPLDERLLARLGGSAERGLGLRVEPGQDALANEQAPSSGEGGLGPRVEPAPDAEAERCSLAGLASATCRFVLHSPAGRPAAALALTVPLAAVEQARADAERTFWLLGGLVLALGGAAAWLLAGSLTQPLARLTDATHHMAAGQYDRPTGVRSADEIGRLSRAFDTMREQVAHATAALRGERDLLDTVLEATGEGILLTDSGGATVVANRRWAELLGGEGLAAGAALERADGAHGTLGELALAWLADPERVAAADFERSGPHYQRFRCYTAPVRYPDRQHTDGAEPATGRLFVVRDMTRESEAERMRSALVSTVSHELRSPLTAIKGYTDTLLQSGPWDASTEREFLEIVAQSAEKLSNLVDNLLDAAKLEAGVLHLEPEPVRVERIAERVVAQRRPLTADHALRVETEPDLPLAYADPARVEQVICNLVENAIKYSPAGGPITVRVGSGDALTVSVTDRGGGIASEHLPHLFERFYRVDNRLTRGARGVGLGLFICKSLVEAHGGRIWVESRPGAGSTFAFTLPAFVETAAPLTAAAGASQARSQ